MNSIGLINVTLSLFIAVSLFQKRNSSLEIKVLIWLFFLWSIRSLLYFFFSSYLVERALLIQNITLMEFATVLCYIRLINKKKFLTTANLIIFSPILLYSLYTIGYYSFTDGDQLLKNYVQMRHYDPDGFYGMSKQKLLFLLIRFLLFSFFIVLGVREFFKYRDSIQGQINKTNKKQLYWLMLFIIGLLVVYIVPDFLLQINKSFFIIDASFFNHLYRIVFCVLIVFIGMKGLNYNTLDLNIVGSSHLRLKSKYSKSGLKELEVKEIFLNLQQDILNRKLYLDPELTLRDLAQSQNLTTNTISQVINSETGKNFYDFINTYRIDEVKTNLASSKETILQIAFACGFNSKSTFNSCFKREVGVTPSQFRKKLKNS